MTARLCPSPTPKNVADAYRSLIADEARKAAGKDGRLTARESEASPFIADAYARAGKKRPVVSTVAEAAHKAMLEAATAATHGDGRVSGADAATMPAIFAQAFQTLRGKTVSPGPGPSGDSAELAARFGRLADGLLFMSESDDPYVPFHVALDPSTPLTAAALKTALTWEIEEGDPADFPDEYPNKFEVQLDPANDAWTPNEDDSDADKAKQKALETAMLRAFPEISAPDSRGHMQSAKIWSVTAAEEGAPRAPYYIFGRFANGDLVGLKTWRTWT